MASINNDRTGVQCFSCSIIIAKCGWHAIFLHHSQHIHAQSTNPSAYMMHSTCNSSLLSGKHSGNAEEDYAQSDDNRRSHPKFSACFFLQEHEAKRSVVVSAASARPTSEMVRSACHICSKIQLRLFQTQSAGWTSRLDAHWKCLPAQEVDQVRSWCRTDSAVVSENQTSSARLFDRGMRLT